MTRGGVGDATSWCAAFVNWRRLEIGKPAIRMLAFHRAFEGRLKAGEPIKGKAAALRNAMLELSHNPEFRNPFYWAAFQLLGDGY